MSEFDKTNTAIAFVDNGLFCADGVKAKGKAPILTLKVNFDGVDKEIGLWFATDKETGQYKLTQNGAKMLTGAVKDPYVAPDQQAQPASQTQQMQSVEPDDSIPF